MYIIVNKHEQFKVSSVSCELDENSDPWIWTPVSWVWEYNMYVKEKKKK